MAMWPFSCSREAALHLPSADANLYPLALQDMSWNETPVSRPLSSQTPAWISIQTPHDSGTLPQYKPIQKWSSSAFLDLVEFRLPGVSRHGRSRLQDSTHPLGTPSWEIRVCSHLGTPGMSQEVLLGGAEWMDFYLIWESTWTVFGQLWIQWIGCNWMGMGGEEGVLRDWSEWQDLTACTLARRAVAALHSNHTDSPHPDVLIWSLNLRIPAQNKTAWEEAAQLRHTHKKPLPPTYLTWTVL